MIKKGITKNISFQLDRTIGNMENKMRKKVEMKLPKREGSELSMDEKSVENRLKIRPCGVDSKKAKGAFKIEDNIALK